MTLKSNVVYWTLFRPKYCAESSPGVPRRSSSSVGAKRRAIETSASGADQQLRCIVPEALELIERAGLGMEQVTDEVHEVDQHPASAGQALDVVGGMSPPVELLDDRFRDAADVGIGSPGSDHE